MKCMFTELGTQIALVKAIPCMAGENEWAEESYLSEMLGKLYIHFYRDKYQGRPSAVHLYPFVGVDLNL